MIETFKPKKSKNFVVNFIEEKIAPEFAKVVCSARTPTGKAKKGHFIIKLIHPNTKREIYEKTHKAKDFNEAFDIAKEKAEKLKDLFPTWHEEQKFIPAPKKGRRKLKTKEAFEEEKAKKKRKKTS